MADYFSQIVVRPDIPLTAITGLERRILAEMFCEEIIGEKAYFFARHGPNDLIVIQIDDAKKLLKVGKGVVSSIGDFIRKELANADPLDDELELDMSMIGFETIFQDIVGRSTLAYVEVEAAWTCSKMRPDGFGGMATLITAEGIDSMSTAGYLERAIARTRTDSEPD